MHVVGLYLLRNEADIIETNLRHHFASVIDEAIVIDNGSTDGTIELVSGLAEDLPVRIPDLEDMTGGTPAEAASPTATA